MTWYFIGGILCLVGLVLFIYFYREELWKLQEGFQATTLERVVMCNLPENANSITCALPDDPNKLPPESQQEIQIFDAYEKNNVQPPPPWQQTPQEIFDKNMQSNEYDYTNGIPWDFDNKDQDPNVMLWGFVHPKCSQEIFLSAIIRKKYGSINNFDYDESNKVFTYIIPIFNNLEVSGSTGNVAMFQFAEFLVNFAVGIVVEQIWDSFWGALGDMAGIKMAYGSQYRSETSIKNDFRDNGLHAAVKAKAYDTIVNDKFVKRGLNPDGKTPTALTDYANQQANKHATHVSKLNGSRVEFDATKQEILGQMQTPMTAQERIKFDNMSLDEQRSQLRNLSGRQNINSNFVSTKIKQPYPPLLKSGFLGKMGDEFAAWKKQWNTRMGEISKSIFGPPRTTATSGAMPFNPRAAKAAGGARVAAQAVAKKAAMRVGVKIATEVATGAAMAPALLLIPPPVGILLFIFDIAWTLGVVIIMPVIMAEFIPADGICPTGYPYNSEEDVRNNCGQVCWEIITQIPYIGDLLAALGPFLCYNRSGQARPKIYYEEPLYYDDSSLTIYAMSDKPMVPPDDPAYYDKRQYYQLVGYDFDSIQRITSMNRFLNMLQTAGDLNKHKKAPPPVWVDFADEVMLNKMAEYYYKTSRRLPYTNEDGTLSFEYISKIYGVAASTKFTCDIQCEITIDTIYPQTGVLKSRIIAPSDAMGITYHDRRFYFFVDIDDDLYGETINGNKITYIYKSPTSIKSGFRAQRRDASFYSGSGSWDDLMTDNMARYIITGCTCVDYTAPQASDMTTNGYAGDALVSVANPDTYYFNPTLSVKFGDLDTIPDSPCGAASTNSMTSRGATIPMSFKQTIIPGKKSGNPASLSADLTMYDGTEFGKNIRNSGSDKFQLTLALRSDNKLTFKEITNNTLSISTQQTISYSSQYSGQVNFSDVQNGWPVRIRARNLIGTSFQQFSFDATIQNFTMSGGTIDYLLEDIRNIKGNFNTDGTATILDNGILLYPKKWPANSTKIWDSIKISSISLRQRLGSIFQGITTSLIAQAPGLGLGWQFIGGLTVTALQANGTLAMIACTYQDTLKQPGTYIVNGNILTSQVNNNQDTYIIVRGPTIDYSPGYTPTFNRCSNLSIIQNDCINRYNIRVAVNTYQQYYKNKLVKRIFKIRTIPEKNMCVYDIEQSGFDSVNIEEYDIPNKLISFGIPYTIKTDTCTYVPQNNIILNPPTINEMTYIAEKVDPTKTGYTGTRPEVGIRRRDCNIYTQHTCGSYKIRKRVYEQFNEKYQGNPAINPDTIYKTIIAKMTISTIPVHNMRITPTDYNSDTRFSQATNGRILRFEQEGGPYIFEGMLNQNNRIIDIDILYPYMDLISFSSPISIDRGKTIQLANNNSTWLTTGYYVNITMDNSISFDAVVDSYVNNFVNITPCISSSAVSTASSIVMRYNYKASIVYPYTITYRSTTQMNFVGGNLTFTANDAIPPWLMVNMNVDIILDDVRINGKVSEYNTGTKVIKLTSSDMGSYYTNNITLNGRDVNQLIVEIPNIIPFSTNDRVIVTYISNDTSTTLWNNLITQIMKDTEKNITTITFQITNSDINNSGILLVRLVEDWTNKTYEIYTISAAGSTEIFQKNADNKICTYKTELTLTDYNENTGETIRTITPAQVSQAIDMVITPSETDKCLYDLLYDSVPTKYFYPFVPGLGKYIEFPTPVPQAGYLTEITGCGNNTAYRDCSGIKIIQPLVDKYNSSHTNQKILKVTRAYTIGGKRQCEYAVEMSRQIPGSRDRMLKKEVLRFNMVPMTPESKCTYTYKDEPTAGGILVINEPDPYSIIPDTYAMNPIYVWPTSLIDRYRTFINQAISMYQSMTPTWSSILDDTSQTAENRMKGIFNEIYSNRTLGNCPDLSCRNDDTLTQIVKQYNYDNYPSYTEKEQYGYIQRSIIQFRRGGLGGSLTQCHVELIERHDYYEDYTLPPIQTDDPTMARFNTKYFLRQYQFDLQITDCRVSRVIALTKDDINKNIMDISSNPFGIQSDVAIVQFTPPPDMDLFNLGEFYSNTFLNMIASKYNTRVIHPNAPDKKNKITYFKNAFIVSPTICEYQIVINRNIYSDEYGLWVPTDGIDSYISVKTDSYSSRVVEAVNITEICLMDVNFKQEGETYVPRDAKGNILKLPYMFYTDLTNTKSRVVGLPLPANGIPGPPNTNSSGYGPSV